MSRPYESFLKWFTANGNDVDQEAYKTMIHTGRVVVDSTTFTNIIDLIDHFERKYKREK